MNVRILVTNDDGMDSIGLHELARAVRPHGDLLIVAPDKEYSGAGAALGALHLLEPEVHEVDLESGMPAFAVTGPPALCVLFARLGAFGPPPDLVVSGINPGANVGRSVYHSGTVGAALTARNGGISGIAVSQAVVDFGVEGQGWEDVLNQQLWESAASVAGRVVGGFVADPPAEPLVLNVNVPNLPVDELKGWRFTEVGVLPPRALTTARLEPKHGHERSYRVVMDYGEKNLIPPQLDGGAVEDGYVSVTSLSRLAHSGDEVATGVADALDELLGR